MFASQRKTEKEPLLPIRVFLGHSLCWNPLAEESEKQNWHVSSPCDSREHTAGQFPAGTQSYATGRVIAFHRWGGLCSGRITAPISHGHVLSCDPSVLGQQQQKLFPQLLQEDTCALWHALKLIPASRLGKVNICVLKIRLDKGQSNWLVGLASKSKPYWLLS